MTQCDKCGVLGKHTDKVVSKDLGLLMCPICAVDIVGDRGELTWNGKKVPLTGTLRK